MQFLRGFHEYRQLDPYVRFPDAYHNCSDDSFGYVYHSFEHLNIFSAEKKIRDVNFCDLILLRSNVYMNNFFNRFNQL